MDNIDLRKKSGASRAFPLGTALVSAAFALGAASLTLLLRSDSSGVMSISARVYARRTGESPARQRGSLHFRALF